MHEEKIKRIHCGEFASGPLDQRATFPAHFVGVSELVYPDYSKLLSARWAELTNTTDECDFMGERFDWYG